jgi:hypothetical protein
MRGHTAKKIRRFVADIIAQTPEADRTKTNKQMCKEVKRFWKRNKTTHKFVDYVLAQKDLTSFVEA